MPTERHIHETAKTLRGRPLPGDRPGAQDGNPAALRPAVDARAAAGLPAGRRNAAIVIATNVAESSLTVPRIRYVIDPGTARISRYSPRTKTQRLPIEPVSQGLGRPAQGPLRADRAGHLRAAVQRGGLHGPRRLHGPGDPADQPGGGDSARPRPCGWATIERFPFLDPPKPEAVPRRLPNARRARRAGRQGRADRDRPPVEPPAGRSAVRADDSGRRRRGLPARGADHCRGAGACRTRANGRWRSKRRPTPATPCWPMPSPISSAI